MKLQHLLEAKQQLPEIEAFMKDFDEGTYQHPFARHLRIWQDSIGFEVKPWDGKIDLGAIMSFKSKGEGEASKALKWLTDLADKHGVQIELAVQPIKNAGAEGKSLTKSQLTAWYKRNGFKSSGGEYMLREPKKLTEGIELQYDKLDDTEVGDDRNGKQLEKLGQALAKKLDDRYEVFLFSETFKSSAKNFILYVKPKKKGAYFAVGERELKELMQTMEDMVEVFDGKYLVHFYKSSREIAVELKR